MSEDSKPTGPPAEKCCGCDEEQATPTEMVAVIRENDRFVARAVCKPCYMQGAADPKMPNHEWPVHRKHTIKGHFFHRNDAAIAKAFATVSANVDPGDEQTIRHGSAIL